MSLPDDPSSSFPNDSLSGRGNRLRDALIASRWRQKLLIMVSLLLIALSALLWQPEIHASAARAHPTGTTGATATAKPRPTVTGTSVPAATATILPTTTPSASQRNAARQGCAAGIPRPYPAVINNGKLPGTPGPAPNEVALTFDDGPTPYSTPTVLTALENTHTPATFFVEGQFARLYPDLVRREWDDGFAIGMHSWDHPDLTRLSDASLQHQLMDTLDAVHAALGPAICLWFWRLPYGSYNQRVLQAATSDGLTAFNWDSLGYDWQRPGAQAIANNVLKTVHPGSIVLLHDGPAAREQTAQAIPLILAGLNARGLILVTLPQLLADSGFPGVRTDLPLPPSATSTPRPHGPVSTPFSAPS